MIAKAITLANCTNNHRMNERWEEKKCVTCAGAIVYENQEKRMILIDFFSLLLLLSLIQEKSIFFFVQVGKKWWKLVSIYIFLWHFNCFTSKIDASEIATIASNYKRQEKKHTHTVKAITTTEIYWLMLEKPIIYLWCIF